MTTTFEEELNNSGYLIYTNVGVSMLPLLREGRDVMVIEKREPKIYDAVLFRRPGVSGRGRYVLHRILKALPGERFWIAGDNCTSGEAVDRVNILGVLTEVKRGQKRIGINDLSYRLYVRLWCRPYHLRFAILRLLSLVRRGTGFVRRRLSRIKRRLV